MLLQMWLLPTTCEDVVCTSASPKTDMHDSEPPIDGEFILVANVYNAANYWILGTWIKEG